MMSNAQMKIWQPLRFWKIRKGETGVVILWGLLSAGYDSSLECVAGLHWADIAGRCTPENQVGTLSPSKTAGNLNKDESDFVGERQHCEWTDNLLNLPLKQPECSLQCLLNAVEIARVQTWTRGEWEPGHKSFFAFLRNYASTKD